MVLPPYHRSKGYVLLIVLIFLGVFSSAVLYQLNLTKQQLQILDTKQQHLTMLNNVETQLPVIERNWLVTKQGCDIPMTITVELAKKSVNWWVQRGCSLTALYQQQLYYVVEYLGRDPCVYTHKYDNNQLITLVYYRITLVSIKGDERPILLIQSTLAKADENPLLCQGPTHYVNIGRQSIRRML